MPDVKPPEAKAERKPLRAEVQAQQEIVASRKDAPKRTQMVWTPAPELKATAGRIAEYSRDQAAEVARPFVPPPEIQTAGDREVESARRRAALQTKPLDPLKLAVTREDGEALRSASRRGAA